MATVTFHDNPALAGLLTRDQELVARTALEQECARRDHLVVYLSGAHAYGFPSPDSDLDLKAVHIAPTRRLVGLAAPKQSADRLEMLDGVEIDYTSNELGMVLSGIIGGNGNYIERVLGNTWVMGSPELEQLRPLAQAVLSCKVYRHYAGFARNQYAQAFDGQEVVAKKVLYVLRTTLTGTHLLRTGELVTDVRELLEPYQLGHARTLIEQKRAGERMTLDSETAERWREELERVFALLDQARDQPGLPVEPEHVDELGAWLIEVRKAHW